MQYVLITVTNSDKNIIKYNYFVDKFNKYKNTETIFNESEIAITLYEEVEKEDFFEMVQYLTLSTAQLCEDLEINNMMYNTNTYGGMEK